MKLKHTSASGLTSERHSVNLNCTAVLSFELESTQRLLVLFGSLGLDIHTSGNADNSDILPSGTVALDSHEE